MIPVRAIHLVYCAILVLGMVCNCAPPPPADELTVQYGSELQTAYERYMQALVAAHETGDITTLEEMTTSEAQIPTKEQIAQLENPKMAAEWCKVEVIRLRVTEYYTDTAKVFLSERLIGDLEDAPSVLPNICEFRRENSVWKVLICYRPRDDW